MSLNKERFKEILNNTDSSATPAVERDYSGNIENFFGMTQIPTGLTAPLKVNGEFAKSEYQIPLATTEGALVASYSRGAKACSLAGGVNTFLISEGVQRCPTFIFDNSFQAIEFHEWIKTQWSTIVKIVSKTSNYAKIQSIEPQFLGRQLILTFQFHTGDAAGQNMVTISSQAICDFFIQNSPVKISKWYIESNLAGDKKATQNSLIHVRGKKVIAEIILSKQIVKDILKSNPQNIFDYYHTHLLSSIVSGAIGSQGHFANGLAALFLATGQDVACVAEAANGILNMNVTDEGDLYASVSLPNVIVGTVGGGTHLPTQKACLESMDCYGAGKANKFAEIVAALVLCGELSICAAITEGHFTQAHERLGRK